MYFFLLLFYKFLNSTKTYPGGLLDQNAGYKTWWLYLIEIIATIG